ncbi:MAG: MarR family transcriptional regulator, partial [Acidobacteriota bacterium]
MRKPKTAFDLDSTIAFVVGRTCHFMRKAFQKTFGEAGHSVTPEEWVLLNRLWAQDGQRHAELTASTVRDRTTVTRLLDSMVDKGLVRRETDPEDRRGVLTFLTPAGAALKDELIPVAQGLLASATEGISDK